MDRWFGTAVIYWSPSVAGKTVNRWLALQKLLLLSGFLRDLQAQWSLHMERRGNLVLSSENIVTTPGLQRGSLQTPSAKRPSDKNCFNDLIYHPSVRHQLHLPRCMKLSLKQPQSLSLLSPEPAGPFLPPPLLALSFSNSHKQVKWKTRSSIPSLFCLCVFRLSHGSNALLLWIFLKMISFFLLALARHYVCLGWVGDFLICVYCRITFSLSEM